MGLLNDLGAFTRARVAPEPAAATDDERAEWFAAADVQQNIKQPAISTVQQLRGYLVHKNPVRMRRLKTDFKWMQKELTRLGRNPEDARWLL